MLLFRSEEHVQRWCRSQDRPAGQTMTLQQQWRLAQLWHTDRRQAAWRRHTPREAQDIFDSVDLTGDFWRLTPPDE